MQKWRKFFHELIGKMSDLEDLDCPDTRSSAVYIDDLEQADEKCIIFEEDGSFGNVYQVHYDREIGEYLSPNTDLPPKLQVKLIELVNCVGKVSAVYNCNGKPKVFRGSGFWISPDKIMTARHVVKSPRTIDGVFVRT